MEPHFSPAKPESTRDLLSVSELNRVVAGLIERSLPMVRVSGELSNLVRAASGHWYFSLKDAGAQVRAVMFRGRAQALSFIPKEGTKVEVYASAGLYQARGDFQLQIESMRLAGAGDLHQQFLRLKARLQAEGLFDEAAKRPIPGNPRAVAVICSPQAAALRDVLITLRRRAPQLKVYIFPSLVQGLQAPAHLVNALAKANEFALRCAQAVGSKSVDSSMPATAEVAPEVVLLVRGGGSLEDLWAYNDEALARAIRASALPVVSGVGHESDISIADFAADQRAATPTAAAVLVSPDQSILRAQLKEQIRRLMHAIRNRLNRQEQDLDYAQRSLRSPMDLLAQQSQQLKALAHRLSLQSGRVQQREVQLQSLTRLLSQALKPRLQRAQLQLDSLDAQLALVSPLAVLDRGYAILSQDHIIRDPAHIDASKPVNAQLAKGQVKLRVAP